jgi:manganese/zinc/iron transport system permease protein
MTDWGWSWTIDGWIILAGILGSVSAALLGNFLVLRKMSLLGDAISHAVLPGLVVAFFLSGVRPSWILVQRLNLTIPWFEMSRHGSRTIWIMFAGAVVSGIVTAILTQWIKNQGKIDEGASMGVVFTTLFALGLVFIVQAADYVDLDPGCVLYGSIETTPLDTISIFQLKVPRVVITLACVCLLNLLFVLTFYKELKLSSFDPSLATTSGFNASFMHYLLMTLVAVTTVACFESVGNILVVAMLIVPASTALLLSERLGMVIVLSAVIASLSAVLGHIGAITIPKCFGFGSSTTAGMMAVAGGIIFFVVSLFAPRSGVVVRWARRKYLGLKILSEDIVSAIYRFEERGQTKVSINELSSILIANPWSVKLARWWQLQQGLIQRENEFSMLTERGREAARGLVRTHRLWESYLVDQAGSSIERIHMQAERLEHFTNEDLKKQLQSAGGDVKVDPHGREIPSD